MVDFLVDKVEKLEIRINSLENNYSGVNEKLENITSFITDIKSNIKELLAKIDEIKEKPGKRWDLIITVLITSAVNFLVVGALAAIMFFK